MLKKRTAKFVYKRYTIDIAFLNAINEDFSVLDATFFNCYRGNPRNNHVVLPESIFFVPVSVWAPYSELVECSIHTKNLTPR